jgi:hypothetical protein
MPEAGARIKTIATSSILTPHVLESLGVDPFQKTTSAPPQLTAMRRSRERQVETLACRARKRFGTMAEKKSECVARAAVEACVNAASEEVAIVFQVNGIVGSREKELSFAHRDRFRAVDQKRDRASLVDRSQSRNIMEILMVSKRCVHTKVRAMLVREPKSRFEQIDVVGNVAGKDE